MIDKERASSPVSKITRMILLLDDSSESCKFVAVRVVANSIDERTHAPT